MLEELGVGLKETAVVEDDQDFAEGCYEKTGKKEGEERKVCDSHL